MSVNGGSTATSTRSKSCFLSCSVHDSFCSRCTASTWLRFIFQLPAINGVRAAVSIAAMSALFLFQYGETRELLALQVLQRRATTGGDVAERVVREAQLPYGGRGVTATDDAQPVHLGHRLRDGLGSARERRHLEYTHRAVPEHRLGAGDLGGERLAGLGTDVQTELVGRHRVRGDHGRRGVGLELGRDDDVGREHDLDTLGLRRVQVALDHVDLVFLEQARADLGALRLEEREDHAATDQQLVRLGDQVVDHRELVRYLRATEYDDVRALRVLGQLLQYV